MSKTVFVEYPKCSTCRRAKAWLDSHGVDYIDRDIVRDNPRADELRLWWRASGLPLRRFFNTSGRLYRERGVKALLDAGMSDDDALELLADEGMMVKRPIVVRFRDPKDDAADDGEGRIADVLVGFRDDQWEQVLLPGGEDACDTHTVRRPGTEQDSK